MSEQYEEYGGYWIVKDFNSGTFRVKTDKHDGHSLHHGTFASRNAAKEWIDDKTLLVEWLYATDEVKPKPKSRVPPYPWCNNDLDLDEEDKPPYKTCGESGTDKCEARAYQITARQLEFKIIELQSRMSAIHAIASALPKLDWESHEQFCLFEDFNEAVQTIQGLSK